MKLIVAVLQEEDEAAHHCRVESKKAFLLTELATTRRFPEGEEHNTADRNR